MKKCSGLGMAARGGIFTLFLTLSAMFSPPPAKADCVSPPAGLVAWYRAEGNAYDSFGTNNGTISGTIAYAPGDVGQAFVFTNNTGYIPVAAASNLDIGTSNGITIEAWIKPNGPTSSGMPIVEWDSSSRDGLQLWVEAGYMLFANINDTSGVGHTIYTATGVVASNVLQHVAVTYDKSSGSAVLYLNGSAVVSSNLGVFTPQTSYPSYHLNIGRRTGQPIGDGSTFWGLLDELSIYGRALSQSEIQAIYNADGSGKCVSAGACTPLPTAAVGWWSAESNALDNLGVNNGMITNGTITYTNGEVGKAFHYNGAGGYVQVPASSSLNVGRSNGFTLEGWIRPADLVNQRPIFEWRFDGIAAGVHFWISAVGGAGCLYANIMDTNNAAHPFYSATGLITSDYQHVALTYDKTTGQAAMYRNGLLVASTNFGIFVPRTTGDLLLGERTYLGGASQYNYTGDLDEMAVYGRVLPQSELQAIYSARAAGKCSSTPSANCTPAPTNIVSWWRAEGNGNDEVSANTAVLQSGVVFGGGKVGQAFLLNNTNAYAVVPPSPSLNVGLGSGFTIEGWINVTNVNGFHPIAEWSDLGNPVRLGAQFWIGQSTFSQGILSGYIVSTNGGYYQLHSASGVVVTNQWQHVAFTYDKASGVAKLLVNGNIVAQSTFGTFVPQTSYNFVIGRRPTDAPGDGTYNAILNGALDEFSLYNRALNQSEIQGIYAAGSGGKCNSIAIAPPTITTQPVGCTNDVGSIATFTVVASGSAPLSYQWLIGNSPISGATNAALAITNVQLSDGGNYSVFITNVAGSVQSSNALLTVHVPVCTPIPTGLAGWWRGESNGNDEASANSAILHSGVAFGAGKVGQSFVLNNTDAYMVVPSAPSLNIGTSGSFTIEGWIKVANVSGFHPICEWSDLGSPVNLGVQFWIGETPASQGVLSGYIVDTKGGYYHLHSPASSVVANQWQHVAFSYDNASGLTTLYVNGQIVVQANFGSFIPQTGYNLVIGRRPTDQPGDWTYNTILGGALDDLSLYSRALSQAEIQGIYNADSAGKCGPVGPSIVVQPSSRTNNAGTMASFNVLAGGTAPLSYQWEFEGAPIAGATGSTLSLPNVLPGDAGNYSVLVTNLGGSVLSSNAALTVLVPDCISTPTNLVSWWRAESNANDTIGTNNGVVQGTMTYTNGKVGQAFVFDTSSYVLVPASASLNIGAGSGMTIEAWVKPDAGSAIGVPIVEWDSDSTDGLQLWCEGTFRLFANIKDTSGTGHAFYTSNGTLSTNGFQHVAVTYDKSTGLAVLYRNGIAMISTNLGSFTPQTTYPMNIGRRTGQPIGLNKTFSGLMDEVGIYNRALSSEEIQSNYNAGIAGKCVPVYPPTVTTQPTNVFTIAGSNITFTVAVTGTDPLSYQWSFNNAAILGATNTSLTISNAQNVNEGVYAVTVTNLYGSATSSNAVLVVDVPPVADASATTPLLISVNNSNATVVLDGTLSYDADGDALHYLWLDAQTNSLATGVVAVVILPVATNVITLVVNDGFVSSSDTVTVEVITVAQALERLEGVVDSDASKKNALVALLNAALAAVDRSSPTAAVNQLLAFQNMVNAQLAPIDPTLAQFLIDEAQSIIDAIAGGGNVHGHAAVTASLRSDRQVHIGFTGTHQQIYIIEASTNLQDWEKIGVAKEQADGSFSFDDAEAAQKSARFYRITVP